MIDLVRGNILEADVDALVNAVNCVGVMGKGLALQFKKAFPDAFRAYQGACRARELAPGRMHVVDTTRAGGPKYVIHFPTKRHWRDPSRLEDIEAGLDALVQEVRDRGIRSIAVPALGCGLGGLDWADVRPLIEDALGPLESVRLLVFEPR
jgi:O-acetyl-ADP-ribose deacetylase (regulator of RNase III)